MKRLVPYILLALFLGSFVAVYTFLPKKDMLPPSTAPYQERVAYWREKINVLGGEGAYEAFARILKEEDLYTQHTQAHLFGAALYEEVGFEGVVVCDSKFEHGCFHQLTGDAVADLGLDAIAVLSSACEGSPGGCAHGIGHGALGVIGYEFSDLLEALEVCDSLPYSVSMSGCHGGAIMEYNVRTMLADATIMRAPGDNWHHPCDALSPQASQACYFWQPSWWMRYLLIEERKSPAEAYAFMGNLCTEIENVSRRWACIEGLGIVSLNFEDTFLDISNACSLPALSSQETFVCTFAVAGMLSRIQRVDDAVHVCSTLPGTRKERCVLYAHSDASRVPRLIEEDVSFLGAVTE